MFSKKDFQLMRKEYHEFDKSREKLIKISRAVVKLSKQTIYAIHRNDLADASKLTKNLNKEFGRLNALVKRIPNLKTVGQFKSAAAEFAEAMLYYGFVKNKRIPTHSGLLVSTESYLLGLCDFTGELTRMAVFLAGKNKVDQVIKIKDLVDNIYWELLKFDFRNGELRKKFDSIKYLSLIHI